MKLSVHIYISMEEFSTYTFAYLHMELATFIDFLLMLTIIKLTVVKTCISQKIKTLRFLLWKSVFLIYIYISRLQFYSVAFIFRIFPKLGLFSNHSLELNVNTNFKFEVTSKDLTKASDSSSSHLFFQPQYYLLNFEHLLQLMNIQFHLWGPQNSIS